MRRNSRFSKEFIPILNLFLQTNKQTNKHLESVHSNNKSHNGPVCDLSLSRIDILERHANHFYEDSMSHNMIKL